MLRRLEFLLNRYSRRRKPLSQAPDISDKTFVFIGGLHRSGTSILHRLLCEHPAASGFAGTGVAEDEGQHLQSVYRAAYYYGGPGQFAFHPDAHLTEDSSLARPEIRDQLLRQWGAYYDLRKTILLEKSPPNLIMSRFLRALLPGSRFVFIVRHPIAVSLATEKWSSKTLSERMLHWHRAYSIMLDDIDSRDDCLVIRYEDLVASTAATLDRVCRLAGMGEFSPSARVADHNDKYFEQWQRQAQDEVAALNAVPPPGENLLERFGYSLSPPFVDRSSAS